MPTFIPPTTEELQRTFPDPNHPATRLFRYYDGQHTGRTVWRDPAGVFHESLYPYNGGANYRSFDNGKLISDTFDDPNQSLANATRVYLGGHVHIITQAEADDLTAAGYGAFITP